MPASGSPMCVPMCRSSRSRWGSWSRPTRPTAPTPPPSPEPDDAARTDMNRWLQHPRPLALSHRGHSVAFPENTMAAFRAAVEAGVDAIESDVHLTADGQLVMLHDE